MGRNKITFFKGHTINNGRILTIEHKEKIRMGLSNAVKEGKSIGRPKGGIPWNKGMRRAKGDPIPSSPRQTEEGRKRISESMARRMKGKRVSPLTEFKKGERISPQTEFKKGNIPWIKGKHPIAWNKGLKEKTSRSPEIIRKALRRRVPTSLEYKFQEIINRNELPYKYVGNGEVMIGRKNPDFININGEKIAIEVYARYYKLRHIENLDEWKENRKKIFNDYGWELIFFDETQVNENNILQQLRR